MNPTGSINNTKAEYVGNMSKLKIFETPSEIISVSEIYPYQMQINKGGYNIGVMNRLLSVLDD